MIRKFIISAVLLSFLGNDTTYASDEPSLSEILPDEVHRGVFSSLELSDLNSLSFVCTKYRTLVWDLDFFKYSKVYVTEICPEIKDDDFDMGRTTCAAVLRQIQSKELPEGFRGTKFVGKIAVDYDLTDVEPIKEIAGQNGGSTLTTYKTALNDEYKNKFFRLSRPTIFTCLSNGLSSKQCVQVLKKMIHSVCFCESQWELDNGIGVDPNYNSLNMPKNFLLPESKPRLSVIWSNIHNKKALLALPYLPSLVSFGLQSWEMSKSKLSSLTPDEQNKGRENLTKIVIAMDNFDEFRSFWNYFSRGMTDKQHLELLSILADNTIVRKCKNNKFVKDLMDERIGYDVTRYTNYLLDPEDDSNFLRMGRDSYTFGMWISYILRSVPENLSIMLPEDKIKWLEEHKNKYVHN